MVVKNLPAMQETWVQSLGGEDSLGKGMATRSSTLAWRIPWTEEPGGLQSIELQRAGHDWATNTFTSLRIIPWSSIGWLPVQMYIVNDRCRRACRHMVYKVTIGWVCLLRSVLFIYLFIGCTACGILVPRPGIEPGPLAVKAPNPNRWTTREFLRSLKYQAFLYNGESKGFGLGKSECGSLPCFLSHQRPLRKLFNLLSLSLLREGWIKISPS